MVRFDLNSNKKQIDDWLVEHNLDTKYIIEIKVPPIPINEEMLVLYIKEPRNLIAFSFNAKPLIKYISDKERVKQ